MPSELQHFVRHIGKLGGVSEYTIHLASMKAQYRY